MKWSDVAESLSYEDGSHPVCVVHLAWIPCRHSRPDSPCEWRDDEMSQTIVGRFHGGKISRWDALAALKETVGSTKVSQLAPQK